MRLGPKIRERAPIEVENGLPISRIEESPPFEVPWFALFERRGSTMQPRQFVVDDERDDDEDTAILSVVSLLAWLVARYFSISAFTTTNGGHIMEGTDSDEGFPARWIITGRASYDKEGTIWRSVRKN